MRKIRIDADIEGIAAEFNQQLSTHKKKVIPALDNLKDAFDGSHSVTMGGKPMNSADVNRYHQYVEKLKNDYNEGTLTLMKPNSFETAYLGYNAILSDAELSWKISIDKDDAKNLHKRIIEAMGYQKYVRNEIFPKLMKKIGVKACVYCNANYTIGTTDGDGFFELDHWKPESKYPFLCTSFYNLQPSCPHCNKRKGSDSKGKYLKLYEENPSEDLDVFEFEIPKGSLVRYFNSLDTSQLKVKFKAKDVSQVDLRNKADEKFGIESIYNEHMDVVEEMMWRAKFYNDSVFKSMAWAFGKRWPIVDMARFKLGTYGDVNEIHKRPLSLLMQDIGKQLGLI